MSEKIRELVDVLRRLEQKIAFSTYVKSGLVYLYWAIAMAGFMVLSILVSSLLVLPSGVLGRYIEQAIVLVYWITALVIVFYKQARFSGVVDEIIGLHYSKLSGYNSFYSRRFKITYVVGWLVGGVIGWYIIPALFGEQILPVGFLVFLSIGNLSIYLGIPRRLKHLFKAQLIYSILMFASAFPTLLLSLQNPSWTGWPFAVSVAMLLYMLMALHYFVRSIESMQE